MDKELTTDQKQAIVNFWNDNPSPPPDLQDLINSAFPGQNIDGRSKDGRSVRKFLASRKLKAQSKNEYKPRIYKLSESDKEFISNSYETMTGHEIAKTLFGGTTSHRDKRTLAVVNEIKEVTNRNPNEQAFQDPSEVNTNEYRPPKSAERSFVRIKKYVNEPFGGKQELGPKEKKSLTTLINYLSTFRFSHQINGYETVTDKNLFESSFVRYTYDKPDLTQEEVDQYIVLSQEVVISAKILRRVERLQVHLDRQADESEEGARISMSLVQSINTAQTEYNQCVNRQQRLLSDLKEKRSDRLKKLVNENASILNLVELWKAQESREKLVKLAKLQKENIQNEVGRLSSIDEIKARILGLTEEEALNG
jgi:hypothetical protein|tara:strand:+ start:812 stop:1909 length:1098 start_codon:yes stop_codon:yes gene_type:complete